MIPLFGMVEGEGGMAVLVDFRMVRIMDDNDPAMDWTEPEILELRRAEQIAREKLCTKMEETV